MAGLRLLAVTPIIKSILNNKKTFLLRGLTFLFKSVPLLEHRVVSSWYERALRLPQNRPLSELFLKICYQLMEEDILDQVNFLFENVNVAYQKTISYSFVSFKTCTSPNFTLRRNKLTSDFLASSMPNCIASSSLGV